MGRGAYDKRNNVHSEDRENGEIRLMLQLIPQNGHNATKSVLRHISLLYLSENERKNGLQNFPWVGGLTKKATKTAIVKIERTGKLDLNYCVP